MHFLLGDVFGHYIPCVGREMTQLSVGARLGVDSSESDLKAPSAALRAPSAALRDPKTGHFIKGHGMPGPGRPKGIVQQIRELDNGTIIPKLFDIWMGNEKGFGPRERMQAAQILLDRGYGKAVETSVTVDMSVRQASGQAGMSQDALLDLFASLGSSDPALPAGAPTQGANSYIDAVAIAVSPEEEQEEDDA